MTAEQLAELNKRNVLESKYTKVLHYWQKEHRIKLSNMAHDALVAILVQAETTGESHARR